jgi:hypothetical protein
MAQRYLIQITLLLQNELKLYTHIVVETLIRLLGFLRQITQERICWGNELPRDIHCLLNP